MWLNSSLSITVVVFVWITAILRIVVGFSTILLLVFGLSTILFPVFEFSNSLAKSLSLNSRALGFLHILGFRARPILAFFSCVSTFRALFPCRPTGWRSQGRPRPSFRVTWHALVALSPRAESSSICIDLIWIDVGSTETVPTREYLSDCESICDSVFLLAVHCTILQYIHYVTLRRSWHLVKSYLASSEPRQTCCWSSQIAALPEIWWMCGSLRFFCPADPAFSRGGSISREVTRSRSCKLWLLKAVHRFWRRVISTLEHSCKYTSVP